MKTYTYDIKVRYDPPPIPDRQYDWHAILDDYDGAPDAGHQPVGHGPTMEDAVLDLLERLEDDQHERVS